MVLEGKWRPKFVICLWFLSTFVIILSYKLSSHFATWISQLPDYSSTKGLKPVCIEGIEGPILTAVTYGRLGNQMYLYATIFATLEQEKHSRRGFMNPRMFDHLSPYFKVSLPELSMDQYHQVNWTQLNIDHDYPTVLSFENEAPCLRICCFPQQWELFDSIRDLIQQEFTFHGHIVEETEQTLSLAVSMFYNNSNSAGVKVTLVGVHVRRTDYVAHANQVLNLNVPDLSFYQSAMEYMAKKYPNIVFIVTSDDIVYCKQLFGSIQSSYQIYYMEGRSENAGGLDMSILSKCDHVIYGIGTFGFWAAYLNKGEVIYCSCAKNTSMLKDYYKFTLPSWTGISAEGLLVPTRSSEMTGN